MVVFKLWRGVSLIDGEYITIIEDVKNGLFCEVFYDEKRRNAIWTKQDLCGKK